MTRLQRGGTAVGFILGLVVGLGVALGVAVYVTKVPVPFLNKGALRNADQEAQEAQRNRNWDPNAPLAGSAAPARPEAAKPASGAASGVAPAPLTPPDPEKADRPENETVVSDRDAKAPASTSPVSPPPSVSADPLGDLAKERANAVPAGGADPFQYYVQAGAFRNQADADAQRAKLAMMGWEARVSLRDQNGRPVFRVRIGPFDKRGDAQDLKEKLDSSSFESALVRVQR